jgi:hypothetical protein
MILAHCGAPQPHARLIPVRELDAGGLEGGDHHARVLSLRRARLPLIQPGALLGEKRTALAGKLKGRARITLYRLDIAAGEKPLQVAALDTGKPSRVVLFYLTKQLDLRIRQLIGASFRRGARADLGRTAVAERPGRGGRGARGVARRRGAR